MQSVKGSSLDRMMARPTKRRRSARRIFFRPCLLLLLLLLMDNCYVCLALNVKQMDYLRINSVSLSGLKLVWIFLHLVVTNAIWWLKLFWHQDLWSTWKMPVRFHMSYILLTVTTRDSANRQKGNGELRPSAVAFTPNVELIKSHAAWPSSAAARTCSMCDCTTKQQMRWIMRLKNIIIRIQLQNYRIASYLAAYQDVKYLLVTGHSTQQ